MLITFVSISAVVSFRFILPYELGLEASLRKWSKSGQEGYCTFEVIDPPSVLSFCCLRDGFESSEKKVSMCLQRHILFLAICIYWKQQLGL